MYAVNQNADVAVNLANFAVNIVNALLNAFHAFRAQLLMVFNGVALL